MRSTRRLVFRAAAVGTALVLPLATPGVAQASGTTMTRDLYRLRMCESGGNYRINTGNGYYGAYQFSLATWHGLGYRGRPNTAAPKTQNNAAIRLHGRDGWRPWPACARREGLD